MQKQFGICLEQDAEEISTMYNLQFPQWVILNKYQPFS